MQLATRRLASALAAILALAACSSSHHAKGPDRQAWDRMVKAQSARALSASGTGEVSHGYDLAARVCKAMSPHKAVRAYDITGLPNEMDTFFLGTIDFACGDDYARQLISATGAVYSPTQRAQFLADLNRIDKRWRSH